MRDSGAAGISGAALGRGGGLGMGLDIMIVRGSVAGWRIYDALDRQRTALKQRRPEHETPEAEARRERLDQIGRAHV